MHLTPANQVVELSSITGFGPNEDGTEREWGSFTQLNNFPNAGTYNTSRMLNVGPTLAGGSEEDIRKLLDSILPPADAFSLSSWISGSSPYTHKLSRFNWTSHSYFAMPDGKYVNRALFFKVERVLESQGFRTVVTPVLPSGYERVGHRR